MNIFSMCAQKTVGQGKIILCGQTRQVFCWDIGEINEITGAVAVLGGGLRGLEHPPRSKFRLQRQLIGIINSFSSAKTHCGEPMRARAQLRPQTNCATRMRKIRGVVPTLVCVRAPP